MGRKTEPGTISIDTAREVALRHLLRQVIIVGWDGADTHITTYGEHPADSEGAAKGGNLVKKALGWPDNLQSVSPKVEALQARIVELELALAATQLKPVVEKLKVTAPTVAFIVEMTEYERGWGQRPDGYLVFHNEAEAKAFVHEQTKDRTGPAPDEYVRYDLIGYKPASSHILSKLAADAHRRIYIDHLKELTQ